DLSAVLAQLKTELAGQWQQQLGRQELLTEQVLAALRQQAQDGDALAQVIQQALAQWQEALQVLWRQQQDSQGEETERLLTRLQQDLAAQTQSAVQEAVQASQATPVQATASVPVAEEALLERLRGQLLAMMQSQQVAQAQWAAQLAAQLQEMLQQQTDQSRLDMADMAERVERGLQAQETVPDQTQALAERVVEQLSDRLEQSLGSLSQGLAELRERLVAERSTIVATVADWREDSSRSEREQSQQMDHKLAEVIGHVNTHHHHLTRIIGELNQTLSQDLEVMREGLLSRNESSTQQMLQRVSDLGRGLEEVISTVGQEQTVFIEMLGERLEALRRRLRTK
ncbi:MAG: hypothetical protein HQM05_16420, partial [Magnetococcales bacterium]|nr:hypothetical protein [Magnetococcales bacterium]